MPNKDQEREVILKSHKSPKTEPLANPPKMYKPSLYNTEECSDLPSGFIPFISGSDANIGSNNYKHSLVLYSLFCYY